MHQLGGTIMAQISVSKYLVYYGYFIRDLYVNCDVDLSTRMYRVIMLNDNRYQQSSQNYQYPAAVRRDLDNSQLIL